MKNLGLFFALCLAFCATVPPRPDGRIFVGTLQNLYCVDMKCTVYRSEQPTAADFVEMQRKLGLRSVIKLNTALAVDGGHDVLPAGVELVDDWILGPGPVAIDDKMTCKRLHEIVDDIDDAPKPADLHCRLGDDRTSLVAGLWELWTKSQAIHPSAEAVWREMLAHGFHAKLYPLLVDAFADCSGYDPRKDGAL